MICEDFNLITENCNAKFGAKVVRGAYLEKEKKLAKLNNYSDPINESYEATGEMYLKGLQDISTLDLLTIDFSTPDFKPGLINPRLFNLRLFNH